MTMYAIMRCKKLSSMGSVAGALKHCYRERETPNADAMMTPTNEHKAAENTDEAMGKIRAMLPDKRRKDAVLAVEYVMTASPEWWKSATPEEQHRFFEHSQKWLADKYGADRIITATIHRDETSPHLSAFVVPLTRDGRLSAKEFIGNKTQMSHDQTTFAEVVADLGLQRGIEGSKATHTRIQAYYGALQKPGPAVVTIEPGFLKPKKTPVAGIMGKMGLQSYEETPEAVAERVTRAIQNAYGPTVEMVRASQENAKKAREAQDTVKESERRFQPFVDALAPLNQANRKRLINAVEIVGQKVLAEQIEAERQKQVQKQIERELKKSQEKTQGKSQGQSM